MNLFLAITLILLCGCATPSQPPKPVAEAELPARRVQPSPIGQAAYEMTMEQFASSSSVAPAARSVTLAWDYQPGFANILFNVRCSESLNRPLEQWPVVATTSNLYLVVPIEPGTRFFCVQASNVQTGQVSQMR
jgi:hypothetical protein